MSEVGSGVRPDDSHGNIIGGTVRGVISSSWESGYGMIIGSGIPIMTPPPTDLSVETRNFDRMQELVETFRE